jgi:hypothetical protein
MPGLAWICVETLLDVWLVGQNLSEPAISRTIGLPMLFLIPERLPPFKLCAGLIASLFPNLSSSYSSSGRFEDFFDV